MSASKWSSSSRSCLYWYRRSSHRAIPLSHASGIFQDRPGSGNEGEVASRVVAELEAVPPQDMFHLPDGAKQRLAERTRRAVVDGPNDFHSILAFGARSDGKRASTDEIAMRLAALN